MKKRRRKKIQEAERKKEDCSSGSEKTKSREALLRGRPTSLRIRSGISGGPCAGRQVIPANSAGDAVPKGSPALLRRGRSRAAGPREVFISVWAARLVRARPRRRIMNCGLPCPQIFAVRSCSGIALRGN